MDLVRHSLALAHLDVARLDAHRANCDAFATLHAGLGNALCLFPIAIPQAFHEIRRGVTAIFVVDAHRAGVDAQATTRAGINLGQSIPLTRLTRFQTSMSQQDKQSLRRDVHVSRERQHKHKHHQINGIKPPKGHNIALFGNKSEGKDGPQGKTNHVVGKTEVHNTLHPHHLRIDLLHHSNQDAADNHQKEEVHEKCEDGRLFSEVLEENRIIEVSEQA